MLKIINKEILTTANEQKLVSSLLTLNVFSTLILFLFQNQF